MCLTCTHTHSARPVVCCLPCVSFYCSNECRDVTCHLATSLPCSTSSLSSHCCACYFMGCKGERCVLTVLPMNFVKQLFYFVVVFFSLPRMLTQPLREIEGSGNNLKPYNLLYFKVPLSSERNSLSLESVYEHLYCFLPAHPLWFGQIYTLWIHSTNPPDSWTCMKLGSFGTVEMRMT